MLPKFKSTLKINTSLVTKSKIWLSPPHMVGDELMSIKDAFLELNDLQSGSNVKLFENAIDEYVGNNVRSVALTSGTAAIHLGLKILGVSNGDEVICQSLTFIATANPILYLGAKPIFVDSERETWNISPVLLEKSIKDSLAKGKKPKVIIVVHIYGMPCKMDQITEIANKYDIPILEDSSEAIGSMYQGLKAGSFGNISALSFNVNKIITTSGGGALLTNDALIKRKAEFLATQARDDAPHYEHSNIGYNYRMSNVLAGFGRCQIKVLDERVKCRRENYEYYKTKLECNSQIEFLEEPKGFYSNRWLSCILLPSLEIREKLRLALLDENIESRPVFKPLHLQPVFEGCKAYTDGTSNELFERGLCLPSGSNLTKEELERIVNVIIENLS